MAQISMFNSSKFNNLEEAKAADELHNVIETINDKSCHTLNVLDTIQATVNMINESEKIYVIVETDDPDDSYKGSLSDALEWFNSF